MPEIQREMNAEVGGRHLWDQTTHHLIDDIQYFGISSENKEKEYEVHNNQDFFIFKSI